MKKTIIFLLAAFSFSMLSAVWDAQKTDKFLQDMAKAVDPDGSSRNIKSFEMIMDCTLQPLNMKMQNSLYYKMPNKIKNVSIVPNIQTETLYFNGTKGVKVSTLGGVTPLEGKVLEEVKFSAAEMNPAKNLKDIFHKIEIADAPELRDGKKYVAVNCYSKPETGLFPKKYLVDPQSKLIIYSFSKSNTELGAVEGVTRVLKYKKMHGLMVAATVEQSMMNIKMITNIISFKVNTAYPDSFFEYKE